MHNKWIRRDRDRKRRSEGKLSGKNILEKYKHESQKSGNPFLDTIQDCVPLGKPVRTLK